MTQPGTSPHERFSGLTFESFRALATDAERSEHERVGFPDSYREGREEAIFADIAAKLPALRDREQIVVDIGPGCAGLPRMLRELSTRQRHVLVFVDSQEMLDHHPDAPGLRKVAARFPDCDATLSELDGTVAAVIAYSVLQYAMTDVSPFDFVDAALQLLAPGGRLLLGDVPNASMRKRFLASAAGAEHHRQYTGDSNAPAVTFNRLERGEPDDGLALGIVARARMAGFHAWLVPQPAGLPMANRREDILIERP